MKFNIVNYKCKQKKIIEHNKLFMKSAFHFILLIFFIFLTVFLRKAFNVKAHGKEEKKKENDKIWSSYFF